MNELIPTNDEIKAIEIMSKHALDSKFFNNLNGYGGIFSIAMFARELGLPVMQCLFGGMTNIKGKIEIAPRMMNAMIRKAGHQINIIRSDHESCILKGIRKDTNEFYECSYSISDATKAGLSVKDNYKNYTSDMLFARCMSRLARRLFADVIGNAYVEGEIEKAPAFQAMEPQKYMEEVVIEKVEVETKLVEPPKTEITEAEWGRLDLVILELHELNGEEHIGKICHHLQVASLHDIKPISYRAVIGSLEKEVERLMPGAVNERIGVA